MAATGNLEIPGYYYDSAKRKYFRIEDSRTAPVGAAWSAQNVKRRALEEKEQAERQERMRREALRVKRARALQAPLLGGLLMREAGVIGRGGDAVPIGETMGRAFAGVLRAKGRVNLWSSAGTAAMSSMWVGSGDARRGLGVAYAVLNERLLASSYVPRDTKECINFSYAAQAYPDVKFQPRHRCYRAESVVTSVKFHEPSLRLLVARHYTSGGPVAIEQLMHPSEATPAFMLGSAGIRVNTSELRGDLANTIYAMEPAPASSPLTCIAGTDRGLIQLRDGELTCLTPPGPRRGGYPAGRRLHQPSPRRSRHHHADPDILPWQRDVLSVAFFHHHHHKNNNNPASSSSSSSLSSSTGAGHPDLLLAGTRSGHVCLLDLRTPPAAWTAARNTFPHASSAAHVRPVGAWGVLVAGPRSSMALYDVRWLRRGRAGAGGLLNTSDGGSSWTGSASSAGGGRCWPTLPVVEFPAYRNAAHLQIGLDLLPPETGYGAGLVAAAHDDRTVGLYSLGDGARVDGGDVDGLEASAVVRCLMWQTLPGEKHPGLFVGDGQWIRKYSFWA
ncbi:cea93900-6b1f-4ed6-93aa-c5284ade975f [Thermothielavioides terrestris]|uniref:Cea93900-6b1f-4ed6-93aa-c5284ade975f n=1 Tax=Thermothielavioides terrestris TaxID=2587410 RepID=A0A446BXV1_9PEZI|nr:cea93900-6b1f-4ed6-93aa-c5284ade975f [Thermothielavioides terrestris]